MSEKLFLSGLGPTNYNNFGNGESQVPRGAGAPRAEDSSILTVTRKRKESSLRSRRRPPGRPESESGFTERAKRRRERAKVASSSKNLEISGDQQSEVLPEANVVRAEDISASIVTSHEAVEVFSRHQSQETRGRRSTRRGNRRRASFKRKVLNTAVAGLAVLDVVGGYNVVQELTSHACPLPGTVSEIGCLVMDDLGVPRSLENIRSFDLWAEDRERSQATYNPVATTWNLKVPGESDANSAGVQNYPTIEDGALGTALTIKEPIFKAIFNRFKSGRGVCGETPELKSAFHKWSGWSRRYPKKGYGDVC